MVSHLFHINQISSPLLSLHQTLLAWLTIWPVRISRELLADGTLQFKEVTLLVYFTPALRPSQVLK